MTDTTPLICSTLARDRQEPLYGTAADVKLYLLLEYSGEWRRDAITDNDLGDAINAAMRQAEASLEGVRWLFIKQPEHRTRPGWRFFIGVADPLAPRLYGFTLGQHADLLGIDIAAVVAGEARYEMHRHREPLILVCGNGKRDACCARHGTAAYTALSGLAGEQVWQSSHVAGHRFAATGALLPYGVYLGQLDLADPDALLAAIRAGRVPTQHYRGRSAWPAPAQAAEYFLGQAAAGSIPLTGTRLLSIEEQGDELRVRLERGPERHVFVLSKEPLEFRSDCATEKVKTRTLFHLARHLREA